MPKKYFTKEERLEAKRRQDRERMQTRVIIKGQITRWKLLRDHTGLDDEKVAELLLNRQVFIFIYEAGSTCVY